MEADMMDQQPAKLSCACGRLLQAGASYCDACGQPVAYTGATARMDTASLSGVTLSSYTGATTRLRPPLFAGPSEESARSLAAIRDGMQVRSADGKRLGKIVQVYVRELEAYLHVVSESDWWKPRLGGIGLYIPASTIAEITDKRVILTMGLHTARQYTFRPSWIPRPPEPVIDPGSGTGS